MAVLFESFRVAFESVAQLFLLGLVGWVAVRRGIITTAVISALARLMIDLLLPCLMFMAMLRGFDVHHLGPMAILFALTVVWILLGFGLGRLGVGLWPRRNAEPEDRALIAMSALQNSFYLPIPLVAALLPPDQRTEGLLFIGAVDIAMSFLQWTCAPVLLSRPRAKTPEEERPRAGWRGIPLTPPFLGLLAGCLASQIPFLRAAVQSDASGLAQVVGLPLHAVDRLVPCVVPLAMILLGAVLASNRIGEHHRWRSTVIVAAVRLFLVPAVVLGAAFRWIPGTPVFFLVLAVEAASPPATNLSLIALRYGDQGGHVSSTLLSTYLLSLATLPMWIGIVGLLHP